MNSDTSKRSGKPRQIGEQIGEDASEREMAERLPVGEDLKVHPSAQGSLASNTQNPAQRVSFFGRLTARIKKRIRKGDKDGVNIYPHF